MDSRLAAPRRRGNDRQSVCQVRHDLGAEQIERAQRVGERHIAEEEIAQEIVDAEHAGLPLDLNKYLLRRAGDHRAVGDGVLVGSAERKVQPRGQPGIAVARGKPFDVGDVSLQRRLGDAPGVRVALGDENVARQPDDRAAGKLRLRLRRCTAFRQSVAVGVDARFGGAGRPERHEMQALRASPGGANRARRRIPERRMRLLQRPQRDRHVLVDEVLAPVGERVGRQAGADAVERIDEDVARVVVRDLVEAELVGRDAAADADLEPAVAEMVEHADFLDHAQRRIERQQIDQRPEPHALGRARQRAEIDARNRQPC